MLDGKSYRALAMYRRCVERIQAAWPQFLASREDRLRHSSSAERVAEAILDDLFAVVLDWSKGDLDYQRERADLVLTHNGMKYLVVEAKRPGTLAWHRSSVEAALNQARAYADAQKVSRIAISDGSMLYAADLEHGGLKDRLFVKLDRAEPPESLWWLSLNGISRAREGADDLAPPEKPPIAEPAAAAPLDAGMPLHPKYHLPASCFAYAGSAADPRTWKLPYLHADGSVDERRLPKAIQAMLTNYRGAKVSAIPEAATPEIFVRLGKAAMRSGRISPTGAGNGNVYDQLVEALRQHGRLGDLEKA